MSELDVIAKAIRDRHEKSTDASVAAHAITCLEALGHRILGPGEVDPVTVENDLPSPERVRELFTYDAETGVLHWRSRNRSEFATDEICRMWHGKYEGKAVSFVDSEGYICVHINRRQFKAHRLAWVHHYGEWPNGVIDHIDHDKSNNRIGNLRCVTHAENMQNQSSRPGRRFGVARRKDDGRWVARIKSGGRLFNLGSFETESEAMAARQAAEVVLGFHPNHGKTRTTPIRALASGGKP